MPAMDGCRASHGRVGAWTGGGIPGTMRIRVHSGFILVHLRVYGYGYTGAYWPVHPVPPRLSARVPRQKVRHQATLRNETGITTHLGQKTTDLVVKSLFYLVQNPCPGPKNGRKVRKPLNLLNFTENEVFRPLLTTFAHFRVISPKTETSLARVRARKHLKCGKFRSILA